MEALGHHEPKRPITRLAGERGHEAQGVEPRGGRGAMAFVKQPAPQALPCRRWMYEEGAYSGGLRARIQEWVLALLHLVSAEKSPAAAPPTCRHYLTVSLHDEIGAIVNELGLSAEYEAEETLDLSGGVVPLAERASRARYQLLDCGNIGPRCRPDLQYVLH